MHGGDRAAQAWSPPRGKQASGSTGRSTRRFEQFVDRYLSEVRGVGGNLPADMSAAAFARSAGDASGSLRDLEKIDRSKSLRSSRRSTTSFLQGTLESNIRGEEQVQRWRQDPRRYVETNPITFKLQADPRAPEERGRALVSDMKTLQARIANGKINLTQLHAEVAALRQRAHRRHDPALPEAIRGVCRPPEPGAADRAGG